MQQFQSRARRLALGQVAVTCSLLALACGGQDEKPTDEAVVATASTLFDPPAELPHEAECGNAQDDDGDGHVDCDDLDCRAEAATCSLAPPLDRTQVTMVEDSAAFLFEGNDPIQKGATREAFEPKRMGLLRGAVQTAAGEPLRDVKVSVKGHPEFGTTLSRKDGAFDFAVNAGGALVLEYARQGYLASERSVRPKWQRYLTVPSVALIEHNRTPQAVRTADDGGVLETSTTEPGSRRALVVFRPGTQARAELRDGTSEPLSQLTVSVTEYPFEPPNPSLGSRESVRAAPGSVAGGALHYGLDFSVAEAIERDAVSVSFSEPAVLLVENFLGVEPGAAIPLSYYNRELSAYEVSGEAKAVTVVEVDGNSVSLDLDGDGAAESAEALSDTGITAAEQRELAARFNAGASVLRATVEHFSALSLSVPLAAPLEALAAELPFFGRVDAPTVRGNVLIEPQAVAEGVPVTGAPMSLQYQSHRTAGYGAGFEIEIPLVGELVPTGLKQIALKVQIAGREIVDVFDAAAGLTHTFKWDGKDALGRLMQGEQLAEIELGYVYSGTPAKPTRRNPSPAAPADVTLWQTFELPLGVWDTAGFQLGGFGLDVLHAYDPGKGRIYFGSGSERGASNVLLRIAEVAAEVEWSSPDSLATTSEGDLLVGDEDAGVVYRISADGESRIVAGPGATGAAGELTLSSVQGLAAADDGAFYVVDGAAQLLYRVTARGRVTTLLGDEYSDAALKVEDLNLDGVAIGPRGELYVPNNEQLLRVEGGKVSVIAGGGDSDTSSRARERKVHHASAVAVSAAGEVYFSDREGHRVFRVQDGRISVYAGTGSAGFSGDGGKATRATLNEPRGLALAPNGDLYIADQGNDRIRRVLKSGRIETVVGGGSEDVFAGAIASEVTLYAPDGLALGEGGTLYVAGEAGVYRLYSGAPEYGADEYLVPSNDGSLVYRFDRRGRHQETLGALSGAKLLGFEYNKQGLLIGVSDNAELTTRIARKKDGAPTEIVAPHGQTTELSVNSNGQLSAVTDPLGRRVRFTYADDHELLEARIEDDGDTTSYEYDRAGRVSQFQDPTGYFESFAREPSWDGPSVVVTSADGKATSYQTSFALGGGHSLRLETPDGLSTTLEDQLVEQAQTLPDGTSVRTLLAADPRFGAQVTFPAETTLTTPSGRTLTSYGTQGIAVEDIENPLSVKSYLESTEVNGLFTERVYDKATRTLTTTSPLGRVSKATFDEQGRTTRATVPGAGRFDYSYDSEGRVASVTQVGRGLERVTTFSYGTDGLLAESRDNAGRSVSYARDAAGRVTGITRPDQAETLFELNTRDQITSLTPPGKSAHVFNYDSGLVKAYEPPLNSVNGTAAAGFSVGDVKYSYTKDLAPKNIAFADGRTLKHGYDDAGRLSTLTLARGKYSYSYNKTSGRLTKIVGPNREELRHTFDGPLWTATEWRGEIAGKITADYDDFLRLSELRYAPLAPITFAYDDDSLLTEAGELVIHRAKKTGMVSDTSIRDWNTRYSYNSLGELSQLIADFYTSEDFKLGFTRDTLGRISHIDEAYFGHDSSRSFVYDSLGRLTRVTDNSLYAQSAVISYSYDKNGNRKSVTEDGITTNATYDGQDRLKTYGAWTYNYSPAGDLASKTNGADTWRYAYDELGSLMSVTPPSGSALTYLIDPQGRRIGKKVGGALTKKWLYQDQLRPIIEIDTATGATTQFVYGSGASTPEYMVRGGNLYKLVTDQLGSVRFVVDVDTGDILQELNFDAFGRVTWDTNPGVQPFGFAGGLYDADTGLVRFGARDYDAEIGRWIDKDPIGFAGGDTNIYAYCGSDPVNFSDPSGLEAEDPDEWRSSPHLQGLHLLTGGDPGMRGPMLRRQLYTDMMQWTAEAALTVATTIPEVLPAAMAARTALATSATAKVAQAAPTMIRVSRWGRPGLQSGDWVMKGGVTRWNYIRSFKWERTAFNQPASFSSGESFLVPRSSVQWPKGWGLDGWVKGLYGQRKYMPNTPSL